MKIHFLNVGHGDCTVIEHPSGRITMIDINNSQDYDFESHMELLAEKVAEYGSVGFTASTMAQAAEQMETTDPIYWWKERFGDRRCWRFVLTHPDMDHMRGIKNFFEQVGVDNFWDTNNTKKLTDFRSDADREDWDFYQQVRPASTDATRVMRYHRGDSFWAFNGADGADLIEVLSPTAELVDQCNRAGDSNDLSLVLRVWHAGKSVLLPGDAEAWTWASLVGDYGALLKSDYLKASHHGRDSGYDRAALDLVQPRVVVCSVGRKPATDAHRKYKTHCSDVWSTRRYGDLTLQIAPTGATEWFAQRNVGG